MHMKALFVHSHRFYLGADGEVYSDGKFDRRILDRYLDVFDEVVIASRASSEEKFRQPSKITDARVRFVRLPEARRALDPGGLRAVRLAIERAIEEVDCVIARLPSRHGDVAVEVARACGIKYGVEVVGNPKQSLWHHGSIWGKLLAPYVDWQMRRTVRRSPTVLYVTERYLQQLYPSDGLMFGCSDAEVPEVKAGLRWPKPGERFRVGLIGTLQTAYKGIDVALKALRFLRERRIEAELEIVGEGLQEPWRRLAEKLGVGECTRFLGVLPHGGVLDWLETLHLYIQPSRTEGLPRSVVEAMSRGNVVFGSDAGGIPELLPGSLVHRSGNWRELGEQIVRVVQDRRLASSLSAELTKRAQDFLPEKLREKRLEFFHSIIEQRGKTLSRRC